MKKILIKYGDVIGMSLGLMVMYLAFVFNDSVTLSIFGLGLILLSIYTSLTIENFECIEIHFVCNSETLLVSSWLKKDLKTNIAPKSGDFININNSKYILKDKSFQESKDNKFKIIYDIEKQN